MQILHARKAEDASIQIEAANYEPIQVVEVEIGQPSLLLAALSEPTGRHYHKALCLVRLHTRPLGVVEIEVGADGVDTRKLAGQIWESLGTQINEHLRQDDLPTVVGLDVDGLACPTTPRCMKEREQFLAQAPFVSVIVPTRDRPEHIQRCLQALLALDYPHYEIIIVDNAPGTSATADYIQQTYGDMPQVRYMREDRPNASWARNCGMLAARGELLAFTDDDVVVDRYWLAELVRAFSRADDVICVTSPNLPLELETPAQFWFEEYYGFSWSGRWFTRRIFDKRDIDPYKPALFGRSASMAITRAFLVSIGGFNPALGAGTLALSGEDSVVLNEVVARGHKLVYEPTALAFHLHRRDYAGLRKQIYGYGVGFTALLMKSLLNNPRLLVKLVARLPYALSSFLRARSSQSNQQPTSYPKELTNVELRGMLYGPFAYLLSLWALHNTRKKFPPQIETSPGLAHRSKTAVPLETGDITGEKLLEASRKDGRHV
jgi:glycosyltransferase involved in cell wall biosynthesis